MILIIILLTHLLFLLNTRFTLWPEMVVYPYLLNHGFLLYKDIINPYPPILIFFLSIFSKQYGYHPFPYQVITWFLILFIDASIFFITKRISKKTSHAVASTAFFAFISVGFLVNSLWFDLVQTPFILFSFYFLQKYLSKPVTKSLFLSVFFLTVAFFIKQQAIWFGLFIVGALFWKFKKRLLPTLFKNYYIFIPFLIILCLHLIIFAKSNTLNDFLFWTAYFPFIKASQIPGYILIPSAKQLMVLIILLLFFTPAFFGRRQSRRTILVGLILILFAYPRFDYFHLIPSISILSIAAGENVNAFKNTNLSFKIISILSFIFLLIFVARYFSFNWTREVRFFEKDIIDTSAFIEKITQSDEPIYIQNGPDQILPLSGRLPTKPWAIQFPWYLELWQTQQHVVQGLINGNPKYIIYKPYESSGKYDPGSYRPNAISNYIDENYKEIIQISDTLWLKEKI